MTETDFKQMLPPECFELLQHVWDLLDGQLTAEKAAELERHVEECSGCRKYKAFQQGFLDAMAQARTGERAPTALKRRIEQSLADAGFGTKTKS